MMDGSKGFEDALTGEQKIRNFNINFGPQHPAAHGVCALCWNSTARSWNAAIRISGFFIAAPRS